MKNVSIEGLTYWGPKEFLLPATCPRPKWDHGERLQRPGGLVRGCSFSLYRKWFFLRDYQSRESWQTFSKKYNGKKLKEIHSSHFLSILNMNEKITNKNIIHMPVCLIVTGRPDLHLNQSQCDLWDLRWLHNGDVFASGGRHLVLG